MRLRAKKDDNHKEIANAFIRLGWSWHDTHQLGSGFPDGIAGRMGMNILIEIKDGAKVPSARKLTDDEKDFHAEWRGPIAVVSSIEGVIALHNSLLLQD